MHILIADAFDAKLPERLAPMGSTTSDMDNLGDAHVLLVRSNTKVDAENGVQQVLLQDAHVEAAHGVAGGKAAGLGLQLIPGAAQVHPEGGGRQGSPVG